MKKGGIGGGNTVTGLNFEKKTDFLTLLKNIKAYTIKSNEKKTINEIYFNNTLVARSFKNMDFMYF